MNKWAVDPIPADDSVLTTSKDSNSIAVSGRAISFGGMTWVKNPLSSALKALFLNPSENNAVAPKLELELVKLISPPFWVTKCWA